MKRNELGNFQNSIRLAIDCGHQAIEMTLNLMHVLFDSPDTDDLTKENHIRNVIKWFPVLYEIEIGYTEWEDERYSVSYFRRGLSALSDYFISMKVLIKSMLSSVGNDFDLVNEAGLYPCLLHLMKSVSKLTARIEEEYKSTDWEYYDMREYAPYNRVKKFISHNLSYYAEKHQAPIVNDFCEHALNGLEKFAEGKEVGEISFSFFYPGEHDDICCEFCYDCVKIARYGWDDSDPLDGGTFERWSYILHEDGCGEGEIWSMDISEEIDNGMLLEITAPSEFWYGHEDS